MLVENQGKEKLVAWLAAEIQKAEASLAGFIQKLNEPEPSLVDAFRYSGGAALVASARLDVFRQVHNALVSEESKATVATIHQYVENEVVNKATHVGSSTALLAEPCDRVVLAAWTEVYKLTAQIRDHGKPLFI